MVQLGIDSPQMEEYLSYFQTAMKWVTYTNLHLF